MTHAASSGGASADSLDRPLATGEHRTQTANGVITKLEGNYGLINNALFFDTNVISGVRPSIGDRVTYTTTFNPSTHPAL
ncbi:hypothetical protein PRIPAC_94205 [Pristionchus pacificus]|uniref:S1-like domain-containing protein n=1 Tax=Pristionchus pacificus TaxID=54126 RepID=A0A2A6BA25_PRIPA|nr:hypothetical protein PRIPAC_94205 [Pristionchus pacificus]|eukprot:PDM62735.1 hypothetical protein PRIPAC_49950 [Pristionchus pacificus]